MKPGRRVPICPSRGNIRRRQDLLSYDEVTEKFRECADYAEWLGDKAARIVTLVRDFETLADVRALTAALSG